MVLWKCPLCSFTYSLKHVFSHSYMQARVHVRNMKRTKSKMMIQTMSYKTCRRRTFDFWTRAACPYIWECIAALYKTQIKYLWVAGYFPACNHVLEQVLTWSFVPVLLFQVCLIDNKNNPEMLHKYSKVGINGLSLFIIKSVVCVPRRLTCLLSK